MAIEKFLSRQEESESLYIIIWTPGLLQSHNSLKEDLLDDGANLLLSLTPLPKDSLISAKKKKKVCLGVLSISATVMSTK